MILEAGTAAGVLVFFWIEATVLKYALGQQILLYLFSVLGLVVAGFALYAHVVISLASRILVDMVVPGDSVAVNLPRFGPVESLERMEDYEGALREYLVLARIYPRNYEVLKRTGRVNEILERHDDAVTWYMRARTRAADDQEALAAVNRICAIYDNALEQPDEADAQLAWFLQAYPDSPDHTIVRDRLERRAIRVDRTVSTQLEALDENPFQPGHETAPPESKAMPEIGPALRSTPKPPKGTPIELVTLASEGAVDEDDALEQSLAPPEEAKKRPTLGLESMAHEGAAAPKEKKKKPPTNARNGQSTPRKSKSDSAKPPAKKGGSTLQALDDLDPPAPRREDGGPDRHRKSSISLEAMDEEASES